MSTRALIAALAVVCWPARALAFGLVISPALTDLTVAPGETVTYTVRVASGSPQPAEAMLYAWDYWHGREGRYIAPPGITPRSAAGWIEPVPAKLTVDDKGGDVLVSVSVPRDAEGAYYAMLFAQTAIPEETFRGSEALTAARVGSVLLVHVEGTLRHAIEVTGAGFTAPTSTRAAGAAVHLVNKGNTDEQPEFRGMLRTAGGDVVTSVTARSPNRILPDEAATLEVTWTGEMAPGAYELVGTVLYGDDQVIPVVYPLVIDAPSGSSTPPARP